MSHGQKENSWGLSFMGFPMILGMFYAFITEADSFRGVGTRNPPKYTHDINTQKSA